MAGKGTPGLTPVLERNIRLLCERKQREVAAASFGDRVAARVTQFAGSMGFVYLHIAFVGFWIAEVLAAEVCRAIVTP